MFILFSKDSFNQKLLKYAVLLNIMFFKNPYNLSQKS